MRCAGERLSLEGLTSPNPQQGDHGDRQQVKVTNLGNVHVGDP